MPVMELFAAAAAIATVGGAMTVTLNAPCIAPLVAVTVATPPVLGAVKKPPEVIVPAEAPHVNAGCVAKALPN